MRSPWSHFAGVTVFACAGICGQAGRCPALEAVPADEQVGGHADSARTQLTADEQALARRAGERQRACRTNFAATGQGDAVGGELALTQDNGPWLIVAASFSGDGAEKQARALADELRGKYRICGLYS